jgi:hypothetical protein
MSNEQKVLRQACLSIWGFVSALWRVQFHRFEDERLKPCLIDGVAFEEVDRLTAEEIDADEFLANPQGFLAQIWFKR